MTWGNFSWSQGRFIWLNGNEERWICDDHRTGILQPCDKHISTPVHTPAKISFLLLPGHLDMPLPWFSALFFCRAYCKFSCQGFLRDPFLFLLKNWNALLLSSLFCSPHHCLSCSPVSIPPNKYIDCIRKRNLKII